MAIRYAVDAVRDDQGALRDRLHQIARSDGRVVSITWQPRRDIQTEQGTSLALSGFTIVSEYTVHIPSPDAW
jgi:hypothetical protein